MATLTTTTTALSMKLFIDTKSQRVVFAEAGKDVVDFLFSLLDLPLGAVVSLAGTAAGSVGSLSHSAERDARLRKSANAGPVAAKDPTFSSSPPAASLFFMPAATFKPSRIFFRCKNNHAGYGNLGISIQHCCLYMTDVGGTDCPNCGGSMTATLQHVSFEPSPFAAQHVDPNFYSSSPAAGAEPSRIFFRCTHQYRAIRAPGVGCRLFMADVKGTACPNCGNPMTDTLYYVSPVWSARSNPVQDQEAATYTVQDDLSITQDDPTSAISTVTRLRRLGITDLDAIQERTVRLSYYKGLQILNALLHSKTVLTDVFHFKVRV